MPARVAIAPGLLSVPSRMTMTVVVAQAGTPSTPDLSESRVSTYDLDLDGEGKHASGCNQMPDPRSRIELKPSHVSGGPCRGRSLVSHRWRVSSLPRCCRASSSDTRRIGIVVTPDAAVLSLL